MEYGRCMEGVAMRGVAIGGGVVSEHPRNLCIQKKRTCIVWAPSTVSLLLFFGGV